MKRCNPGAGALIIFAGWLLALILVGSAHADASREASGIRPLSRVDHLVVAVDDLEKGRDQIEALLGVRPVLGGRHPQYGTHNALLSLGDATYLEIIAPDPKLDPPEQGVLFGGDRFQTATLVTWVLRAEEIEKTTSSARSAGVALGTVASGQRAKPDGTVISWKLTDPYAMPLGGTVPFLIAWGDTPHPAAAVPRVGELARLSIEHPEPERVERDLASLGIDADVRLGKQPRLIATIRTAQGVVELH